MTQTADLETLLSSARKRLSDPSRGLPDPVFRFVLQVTPMINVDLLVRNDHGEHLLAWREDVYDKGWHVPGGIIRFNEPIAKRIAAVAKEELAAEVRHEEQPQHVHQFFHRRGHFVSLLYVCSLATPVSSLARWHVDGAPRPGQLRWIRGVPEDLYKVHVAYADWLNCKKPG
jgi:ADP-ribose pyrophosphatase YjhB (NUDIX family)